MEGEAAAAAAAAEAAARIRVVRCPKCDKFLPELPAYSVYVCGGCGAALQGASLLLLFLLVIARWSTMTSVSSPKLAQDSVFHCRHAQWILSLHDDCD